MEWHTWEMRNFFWGGLLLGRNGGRESPGHPVCSQINQTVSVIALLLCWILVFIKLLNQILRGANKPRETPGQKWRNMDQPAHNSETS